MTGIVTNLHKTSYVYEIQLCAGPGNKIGWSQLQRLAETAQKLADQIQKTPHTIRAVWLHAGGTDFCLGANLKDPEMMELVSSPHGPLKLAKTGQRLVETWDQLAVPTVVSATGRIIGAGACLFMASKFRIYSPDASIAFPEIDRGMHLSWGIIPILVRELDMHRARELITLGTPMDVGAINCGAPTLNNTSDIHDSGYQLACQLAAKPPLAMQHILEVCQQSSPSTTAASNDAERFEATLQSADFVEAMLAWAQKRHAQFNGR